jgi:hypothetical protein
VNLSVYYRRRANAELRAADRAVTLAARKRHLWLASRFSTQSETDPNSVDLVGETRTETEKSRASRNERSTSDDCTVVAD